MAIDRLGLAGRTNGTHSAPARPANKPSDGAGFADALRGAQESLSLSNHAAKRIDRRDLGLDAARMNRLSSAIDRAAEKGSRSSVVVLDDLAVVVDVRNRNVVTAMQRDAGRERVFTNIDSVVIA
jgi:flagellar operon protein